MPESVAADRESPMEIEIAAPGEIELALALVFSDYPAAVGESYAENFAAGIHSGSQPADGFLVARRDGCVLGAVLAQTQPGRSALLWPPRALREAPEYVPGMLLGGMCARLAAAGVQVVHALLPSASKADDQLLRQFDFAPLATLLYLQCDVPAAPAPPDGPLAFEPFDPSQPARLHAILAATYEDSLDCPQSDPVRDLGDVVASYAATGVFAADRWMYVRQDGGDIGCLLLTDHPDQEQWELLYMGLAKWARGRGWGDLIVRYALWRAVQAGRRRMVVAVDAENRPAVAMYMACGFQQWQRRVVYYRNLDSRDESVSAALPRQGSPDMSRSDSDSDCDSTT